MENGFRFGNFVWLYDRWVNPNHVMWVQNSSDSFDCVYYRDVTGAERSVPGATDNDLVRWLSD